MCVCDRHGCIGREERFQVSRNDGSVPDLNGSADL